MNPVGPYRRPRFAALAMGAILLAVMGSAGGTEPAAKAKAGATPWVELITIEGMINPAVADYLEASLADAYARGAAALVIQLDTPGGLLSSTRRMVRDILNAPVPVIVFVAPAGAAAASAGTFITEAANVAAMAPGTSIGAAHPVEMTGSGIKGVVGTKLENFTASFARSIARERGRNERWMEAAVRQSASATDDEALAKHIVDLVAPNLKSVLAQASGRTVKVRGEPLVLHLAGALVVPREMSTGQSLLNTLADPNLMYLLMIGGLLGLYFEFAHPGVFLPGVAGAICLVLALTSFQVLPINFSGLLLMLLGVGLLVTEVFVTSYGVLGIGGVIAFVIGSLLLINTSETNVTINRGIIAGAAAVLTTAVLGLGYLVISGRRGGAKTGSEGLIGEVGEVREPIGPGTPGHLFVHGELWRASSDQALTPGMRALVTAVRGLELEVRPIEGSERG
ncbi:MAG TPA: nodulation protein NfeD [Candidatus Binataceae bacterium]|nr:nodulation protein NfeD [Candidatus Binataceae bacterium]